MEQGEIDIDLMRTSWPLSSAPSRWGIDSRGRIKIESKEDMRKRGWPSPDRADAMAIVSLAERMQHRSMWRVTPANHRDLRTKAW